MAHQLTESQKALFNDKQFATVATICSDGQPQLSVVWVKCDGDDVLFSTVEGRLKHKNLLRDPKCTIIVNPPDAPYSYVEVRGVAEMTREGGRELIDEFMQKYRGEPRYTADDGTDNVRVVVRIKPTRVIGRGV